MLTCFPVGVQTGDEERIGLIRDASSVGALLFSKSKFKVDEPVVLSVRVELENQTTVEIKGRVLRVDRIKEGFWTYRMGVVFEPPREDLQPLFKTLAEQQAGNSSS